MDVSYYPCIESARRILIVGTILRYLNISDEKLWSLTGSAIAFVLFILSSLFSCLNAFSVTYGFVAQLSFFGAFLLAYVAMALRWYVHTWCISKERRLSGDENGCTLYVSILLVGVVVQSSISTANTSLSAACVCAFKMNITFGTNTQQLCGSAVLDLYYTSC